ELAQFYEEQFISKFKNTNYVCEYIYEKSLSLVKNGKYEEAIKNLLLILDDKNVNTDKTALAQKLLADCYYNMGKYKEAVVEYLRVIYLYPDKTNLCAEAQYMVGICAEKLNLYDEAKKAYQHSIIKYPGTLWAQEAELKLKKLK
ncbi:MAG: tetratricopeptide repeat protein, partial [Endomicrobia bacterium]|nr:tetratricopeptide repeat protein [Endomicrobiia bacterium]